MPLCSYRAFALILSSVVFAACGGGGGDTTAPGATNSDVVSSDTTTSSQATTTSTSATTSTTNSTTTTTVDQNMPPLSSNRIFLEKYDYNDPKTHVQNLGTSNPDWAEWNKQNWQQFGNATCGDYSRGFAAYPRAHLSIFRNGERLLIPGWIGHGDYCIYNINTDLGNGVIDAFPEYGGATNLTLGDFFQLWGLPLSKDNVGGITGLPMAIYINDNGKLSRYTGEPKDIPLLNFRSITIQLGTPLDEIPTYDWSKYGGAH